ncbi:MAG TPA: helix-turn-helix transcriptional regulator [Actinomycetes bacterium]|nr:helix-turn-helix transcriptional regulator [Actinomycetes bacterium]
MTARLSPTVRRRRLGVELRRLREEAGLTIEQVAKKLECSDSKVSRIETGQVGAMPRDVRDMLELYGVGGEQRDALIQIAREARLRGWWHAYGDVPVVPPYIGLEVAAATINVYGALLVPGLLQTRQYAAAVQRAVHPDLPAEQIERRVELRVARQSILDGDDPPELRTILDEAVLRRPVGGPTIMVEQFRHLVGMAGRPKVTIQVLPFTVGAHTGVDGPFTILGFSTPTDPDVVHLEHTMGDLYLERPEEITRYALAFRGLRDAALRPDASAAFLTDLLKGSPRLAW